MANTVPCVLLPEARQTASRESNCYLPVIPDDVPGQAWDLTLATPTGSVVIPSVISYTSAPAISAAVQCRDVGDGTPFSLNCPPGSTLTLQGSNFPLDPLVSVAITTSLAPTQWASALCGQATVVNSRTITCAVPSLNATLAPLLYGDQNSIRAFFPSTSQQTNPMLAQVMAYPDSPVITSVSGCQSSNGPLTLLGCSPGSVLTLSGANLAMTPLSSISIEFDDPWYYFNEVCIPLSASNSSVQCQLPLITTDSSSIEEGQLLTFTYTAAVTTRSSYRANPFQLVFTWTSPTSSSSSSSSSNSAAIIAAVLVPVLVIAAAVLAWLYYRRVAAQKRGGLDGRSEGSGRLSVGSGSSSQMTQWSGRERAERLH